MCSLIITYGSLCIALAVFNKYELTYLFHVLRCVHAQFMHIIAGTVFFFFFFSDIIMAALVLRFYCSRLPCSSSCWSLFVICYFRCWIRLAIGISLSSLPASVCIMGLLFISYSYTSMTNCKSNKALGSWGELLGHQGD